VCSGYRNLFGNEIILDSSLFVTENWECSVCICFRVEFCTGLELQPRTHPLPEHLFPSPPHPRTFNSQALPVPLCAVFLTPSPSPQCLLLSPFPTPRYLIYLQSAINDSQASFTHHIRNS